MEHVVVWSCGGGWRRRGWGAAEAGVGSSRDKPPPPAARQQCVVLARWRQGERGRTARRGGQAAAPGESAECENFSHIMYVKALPDVSRDFRAFVAFAGRRVGAARPSKKRQSAGSKPLRLP